MKEIMMGKVPDAPSWWKKQVMPKWFGKMWKKYIQGVNESQSKMLEEWAQFIENKVQDNIHRGKDDARGTEAKTQGREKEAEGVSEGKTNAN